VSKTHQAKGLNARDWVNSTLEAAGGGKGGGKNDTAHGKGSDISNIPSGLKAAEAVLHGKF